ncbi:MAG: cold shock domain-containing protein [Sphingobacteriales bacterium]|nr:MAG: cold shock domain-containing protein [Sphingobacteriales bacterium]
MDSNEYLGVVKWFDHSKGFGKIGHPGLGEIFFHGTDFSGDSALLIQGYVCCFRNRLNNRGNRASTVRGVVQEDFDDVMATIEGDQLVEVEVAAAGRSYRKTYKSYSIIVRALNEIFREQKPTATYSLLTEYFDRVAAGSTLERLKKHFVLTCILFENRILTLDGFLLEQYNEVADTTLGNEHHDMQISHRPKTQSRYFLECLIGHYLDHTPPDILLPLWLSKVYVRPKGDDGWSRRTVAGIDPPLPEDFIRTHYKKITPEHLYRLRNQHDDDLMCDVLMMQLRDTETLDNNGFNTYIKAVELLPEEKRTDIKRQLSVILGRSLAAQSHLSDYNGRNNFNALMSFIDIERSILDRDMALDILHAGIPADQRLKLWQETKYDMDPAFLRSRIDQLSIAALYSVPEDIVRDFYVQSVTEMRASPTAGTFARLVFWTLDAPVKALDVFFAALSPAQQAAMWFCLPRDDFFSRGGGRLEYEDEDLPVSKAEVTGLITGGQLANTFLKAVGYIQWVKANYTYIGESRTHTFQEHDIAFLKWFETYQAPEIDYSAALQTVLRLCSGADIPVVFKALFPKCFDLTQVSLPQILEIMKRMPVSKTQRVEMLEHIQPFCTDAERAKLWIAGDIDSVTEHLWTEQIGLLSEDEQINWLRRTCAWVSSGRLSTAILLEKIRQVSKLDLGMNMLLACRILLDLHDKQLPPGEQLLSGIAMRFADESVDTIIRFDKIFERCEGRHTLRVTKADQPWKIKIRDRLFPVEYDTVRIAGHSFTLDKISSTVQIDGIRHGYKFEKQPYDDARQEIPKGVSFCDAVRSKYEEETKRTFYWCCNRKCYQPCQTDHIEPEWPLYSLRDFIRILQLPFSEDENYRFISVVNRANRLLTKLQCHSCKRLLRDAETSEFAFYRVNTFHCTNNECGAFHGRVYLIHCMNWRCNNIVDDRISKACPNGWVICDQCSTCCSHEKLEQRLANLKLNGVFDPSKARHSKLQMLVENKLGHKERNEVFDFHTGDPLEQDSS